MQAVPLKLRNECGSSICVSQENTRAEVASPRIESSHKKTEIYTLKTNTERMTLITNAPVKDVSTAVRPEKEPPLSKVEAERETAKQIQTCWRFISSKTGPHDESTL